MLIDMRGRPELPTMRRAMRFLTLGRVGIQLLSPLSTTMWCSRSWSRCESCHGCSSSPAHAVRMALIHGMTGRSRELMMKSTMVAKPNGVATDSLNSRHAVLTARTTAVSTSGDARAAWA